MTSSPNATNSEIPFSKIVERLSLSQKQGLQDFVNAEMCKPRKIAECLFYETCRVHTVGEVERKYIRSFDLEVSQCDAYFQYTDGRGYDAYIKLRLSGQEFDKCYDKLIAAQSTGEYVNIVYDARSNSFDKDGQKIAWFQGGLLEVSPANATTTTATSQPSANTVTAAPTTSDNELPF